MPARLSGSSASASCPSAALWDGAAAGCPLLGHSLGVPAAAPAPGASQRRRPKGRGAPLPPAAGQLPALPCQRCQGSQRRLEAPRKNIHVPKFERFERGVPWGQPLPACPSGGDKAGAGPSDKGRWDCSRAVPGQHPRCGSWGPPGTSLTLKPSRAHMSRQPVTTTSCYSRLERERDRERQRQEGWGRPNYLLQPKVGMGLFLTPRGVYLLFQPGGGRECLWDTPHSDIGGRAKPW